MTIKVNEEKLEKVVLLAYKQQEQIAKLKADAKKLEKELALSKAVIQKRMANAGTDEIEVLNLVATWSTKETFTAIIDDESVKYFKKHNPEMVKTSIHAGTFTKWAKNNKKLITEAIDSKFAKMNSKDEIKIKEKK